MFPLTRATHFGSGFLSHSHFLGSKGARLDPSHRGAWRRAALCGVKTLGASMGWFAGVFGVGRMGWAWGAGWGVGLGVPFGWGGFWQLLLPQELAPWKPLLA